MNIYHQLSAYMTFIAPYPLTRLSILEILADMDIEPQLAYAIDEAAEISKETRVILVDLFSCEESYLNLFYTIHKCAPHSIIIALLNDNSEELFCSVKRAGADMVVNINNADTQLPAAIRRAAVWDRNLKDGKCEGHEREEQNMRKRKDNIFKEEFTRRSFIKGAAATAAVAGVAVSGGVNLLSPKADAAGEAGSSEQVYQCVCQGDCGGGCPMHVHVRDGKVVKTSKLDQENPLRTHICVKGLSHAQRIYGADRIKYPMRRVGERGSGEWEQITWDAAVKEITDKWKSFAQQYGDSSNLLMRGTGSQAPDQYYAARLFNMMGAPSISSGNDMNGLYMAATVVTRGTFLHGNHPDEIFNAKNVFVWSANATLGNQPTWALVQSAILDHGAKLVVIDPNYTTVASKADKWVPLRPGTDAVLIMAMTNIIIEEDLQDDEYIQKGTVAPFLVKESDGLFLRLSDLGLDDDDGGDSGFTLDGAASMGPEPGSVAKKVLVMGKNGKVGLLSEVDDPVVHGTFTVEGIKVTTAYDLLLERIAEYTPEKASEICDLSVDTIKDLARMYADGPSCVFISYGMDHWVNGYCPYYAIYTMAFIAGQFGKTGAGFHGGMMANMGLGLNFFDALMPAGSRPSLTMPTNKFPEIMETGKYGSIMDITPKSLYVVCGNLLTATADYNTQLEALKKLELIVVADINWNDTSRHADIALPAAHWFEHESFFNAIHDHARISEKAIDPLYESKTDIEICNLLGAAMGYGDVMNMSNAEYLETLLDSEVYRGYGITLETLREKKSMRNAPDHFIFGENFTLPTPTGRGEFYIERPTPFVNYGQTLDVDLLKLPHWLPPVEAWHENPLIKKYPLNLMTHRDKFRVHAQFANCSWLREIEPEPTLNINPVDAEARGIKEGDYVKVYNDRGYVVLKVHFHAGIRPGVVQTHSRGDGRHYVEGHYNSLTTNSTNPFIVTNGFFDTLCEVAKV